MQHHHQLAPVVRRGFSVIAEVPNIKNLEVFDVFKGYRNKTSLEMG